MTAGLTWREHEVLDALTRGLSNKLIAVELDISEHTAKFHVTNALKKIGAKGSRVRAAVLYDRTQRRGDA